MAAVALVLWQSAGLQVPRARSLGAVAAGAVVMLDLL
jgi:hypothetical protein